jgi:tRNA dimethylallyltransferase
MHLQYPEIQSVIFGIHFERQAIRQRITERLQKRLESGMVEEVQQLLATGLPADKIKFYGLEYRFLTQYILGEIDYERMFQLLNTAIHQFAKRQMTWFRRMERSGIKIHWIDGTLQEEEKVQIVMERVNNFV